MGYRLYNSYILCGLLYECNTFSYIFHNVFLIQKCLKFMFIFYRQVMVSEKINYFPQFMVTLLVKHLKTYLQENKFETWKQCEKLNKKTFIGFTTFCEHVIRHCIPDSASLHNIFICKDIFNRLGLHTRKSICYAFTSDGFFQ